MKTRPKDKAKAAIDGRGAKIGNLNALRHGLKSNRLPPRLAWADRRINVFRKIVEQAVIAAKNEINLVDAATINTLIRYEKHAILCGHWLSKEIDNLSNADRIAFSREVANASAQRDKCLRQLEINVQPELPSLQSYIEGKLIEETK